MPLDANEIPAFCRNNSVNLTIKLHRNSWNDCLLLKQQKTGIAVKCLIGPVSAVNIYIFIALVLIVFYFYFYFFTN